MAAFVQIADADAAFFEFTPRENSEVVAALFRGFQGMVLSPEWQAECLLPMPATNYISAAWQTAR